MCATNVETEKANDPSGNGLQHTDSLQSATNKLLAMLETRVADVEAVMAAGFGRIHARLAELSNTRHQLHISEHAVDIPTAKEVAGGVPAVRTPSHPGNQAAQRKDSAAAGALPPGSVLPSPEGSHNEQTTGGCGRASPSTQPTAKRLTKGRRKHIPLSVGVRNPASTDDTTQSDSIEVTLTPPRNPSPKPLRVPILQPRKHNVSLNVPS